MTRSPRSCAASARGPHARIASTAARALLLALVVTGCARGPDDPPGVVRSDSAGVRIVTSGAEDRELPWRFERVDVLRDSAGEPWLFTGLRPTSVLTDRAGRTYALTDDRSIVRFGRDGREERRIGRRGSGPGELQLPLALGSQGDSIVVLDAVREAIVRWGPDLEPIRDLPLTGALAGTDGIAFRSGGLWAAKRDFADGGYTLSLFGDTLGSPPLHRVVLPSTRTIRLCNGMIQYPPFFSPQVTWSAAGPRILVNAEPGYVLWLHEGSRVVASVRRAITPRAPTAEDAERELPDGFRVQFGNATQPCTLSAAEAFEQAGAAELLPPVRGLVLLTDGTMWVQRSLRGEEQAVLDVFGPDGAYAGTVRGMRLPVGLLPNGELLVPVDDADSGGLLLARYRVTR